MRILAAALGATLLPQVALAQTFTLEGPYWGDPSAWDGGQLPTSQENVDATSTCGGNCVSLTIGTPGGAAIQGQARSVDATGRALTIGPGASLNVASLDAASLTMRGGTLTNRGVGPGFGVRPGVTTIQSNGALGASVFSGPGTFTLGDITFVDGSLELRGTGTSSLVNPETGLMTIRNNQTDFDQTGALDLYFESTFDNAGVVDIQGPSQIGSFPSQGGLVQVYNRSTGTLQASDPLSLGLPTRIFPFVDNAGRIAVSSGTLTLASGGYHEGVPLVPAGSSAQLEASGPGVLELWGSHQIGGGTVNITGSGTVQLGGLGATSPTSLYVGGGAVLGTSSNAFFQNAPLTIQSGGQLLNSGNLYAFDTLTVEAGGGLANQGSMQLAGTFDNTGSVTLSGFGSLSGQGTYLQRDGAKFTRTTIGSSAALDLTIIAGQEGSFRQEGGTTVVNGLLRAGVVEFLAGTVGGSGTIEYTGGLTSAVTFGADLTVQPGNSPGILTINGNLDAAGAIFDIEVAGLDPGTLFDQLVVNGDANLDGATVNFRFLDGFLPTPGDTFAWLAVSGFASGLDTLTVSFFSDAGTIGGFLLGDGSLYVDSVTPVPLPPAAWALGSAVLALGAAGRRRRRAAGAAPHRH
ncbi:MAG: hypothetical protein JNM50_14935 [Chromatiales bacterium]|jgi:hypothetical protein|nr:hypothetical protein [Chromatiales bacterium]